MRQWWLLVCVCCVCVCKPTRADIGRSQPEKAKNDLRQERKGKLDPALAAAPHSVHRHEDKCILCDRHIISVDEDFNRLKSDPALKEHVSAILSRLQTFKVPVHPRVRLFYELLKEGMSEFARDTADSLYVPHKYNLPEQHTINT